MIVMKFGGSSVKDAEMFRQVASIIKDRIEQKPVIVLSAVKGTTDSLIASIKEATEGKFDSYTSIVENHTKILEDLGLPQDLVKEELDELKKALEVIEKTKEESKKLLDYISYFGERMSTKILAAHLDSTQTSSKSYISGDIGLKTDSNFGDATMLSGSFEKMNENISKMDHVPVITGFGGKDENGEFTTFQRGGSDYVAALIGSAVDAKEIQIWTDVNGIMTANPQVVKNAKTIPILSFKEASELAYFGAKVLHPKTILPAIEKSIPVLVLNTFEPDNTGSKIVKETEHKEIIKAISYKKGITVISVESTRMLNAHGYLAKIFEAFSKHGKSVDMISTSEVDVSITIDNDENLDLIAEELKDIANIEVKNNKAIMYVVGEGMKHRPGTAGKIFEILGKQDVNVEMISQCFDEISIGFVIDQELTEKALSALHQEVLE